MSTRTDETGGHQAIGRAALETYEWRLDQLRQAGYTAVRAHELAGRGDVDLHVACDLLARGCPEETAFSILT
jgi:hypothetical protein